MKFLNVLAIGVTVGGIGLAVGVNANAAEWTPRTIEQIKVDIGKTNGKEYTIVWGDTLSGISGATNISVQKLADMNKIANNDLIFAGNKLLFDGNVATVQNSQGQTVMQSVIQEAEKVEPNQSVGTSVAPPVSQNEAVPSSVVTPVTDQPASSAPNTTIEQQPNQPTQPTSSSMNGTQGGTTTPTTEENSGGTNGGGTGETEEPTQPVEKFTVWYTASDPADAAHNISKGMQVFSTEAEATAWVNSYAENLAKENVTPSSYGVSSYQV
ncbi:hypothetical protein IGI39_004750 [Enterococcus sp. AZ135]|uniref:LysM peptidoglycan-binding domain-containing protein n=1 Tax=unclassified Enterococcus TaxID=2608891 RepID=UPI003F1ED136